MTAQQFATGPLQTLQVAKTTLERAAQRRAAQNRALGCARARYCLTASRYRLVHRTGCRLWRQAKNRKGYAVASDLAGSYLVTRALYQYVYGALPLGVHLAYRCGNHACINLAHMLPLPIAVHPGRRANALPVPGAP